MAQQRNALRAGIFMVLTVAAVIAIIMGIAGSGRLWQPWQDRVVTFKLTDDIGGLGVGDDVRIGGFKAGVISNIEVRETAPATQPSIVVSFTLPKRYVIREGSHLVIQGTLTGQSWLNFENLGTGQPLSADVVLEGNPSFSSTLAASLGDIAPELRGTMHDIRTVTLPKVNAAFDEVKPLAGKMSDTVTAFKGTASSATDLVHNAQGRMDGIVADYHRTADHAVQMLDVIRDLLGPTTKDWHQTIADFRVVMDEVRTKLPGALDRINAILDKTDTTVSGIHGTLENIQQTLGNARDISASVKSVLTRNHSKFDEMIAALRITGENLKNASSEIRHSPWRLLYKPGPGEMANLNIYDSTREFADGANNLNDAAAALRDAVKSKDANPEQIQKLLDKLDETYGHFREVEQKLWTSVKE